MERGLGPQQASSPHVTSTAAIQATRESQGSVGTNILDKQRPFHSWPRMILLVQMISLRRIAPTFTRNVPLPSVDRWRQHHRAVVGADVGEK